MNNNPKYVSSLREAATYLDKNHTTVDEAARHAGLKKGKRGWNLEQLTKACLDASKRSTTHVEPGSVKERKLLLEADILQIKYDQLRGESVTRAECLEMLKVLTDLMVHGLEECRAGVLMATRDEGAQKIVKDVTITAQKNMVAKLDAM